MRIKYLLLALLVLSAGGLLFRKPITTHIKVFLLVSQEFPQIPIKPLHSLSKEPIYQRVELDSEKGKIVADFFLPVDNSQPKPALILAMGVRTQEKDKPILLGFSQTLARLGYVVFWPRLEVLDKGEPLFEQPQTFVQSFEYLAVNRVVNPQRISFIGFSVGSSTVLVAAEDSKIKDKVHGLVFFGGYYDVFDYLASLASKEAILDGNKIAWQPAEGATQHTKDVFEMTNAKGLLKIFDTKTHQEAKFLLDSLPEEEKSQLKKLNPAENLSNLRANIFILHDRNDSFVPYSESLRLNQALNQDVKRQLLITNLFEHVQPQKAISWKIVIELFKLYDFLYKTFLFL